MIAKASTPNDKETPEESSSPGVSMISDVSVQSPAATGSTAAASAQCPSVEYYASVLKDVWMSALELGPSVGKLPFLRKFVNMQEAILTDVRKRDEKEAADAARIRDLQQRNDFYRQKLEEAEELVNDARLWIDGAIELHPSLVEASKSEILDTLGLSVSGRSGASVDDTLQEASTSAYCADESDENTLINLPRRRRAVRRILDSPESVRVRVPEASFDASILASDASSNATTVPKNLINDENGAIGHEGNNKNNNNNINNNNSNHNDNVVVKESVKAIENFFMTGMKRGVAYLGWSEAPDAPFGSFVFTGKGHEEAVLRNYAPFAKQKGVTPTLSSIRDYANRAEKPTVDRHGRVTRVPWLVQWAGPGQRPSGHYRWTDAIMERFFPDVPK